jgi:phosphoglycerate dehydrogenase-like enzyme
LKILVVNPRLGDRLKSYLQEEIEIITPEHGNDEELIKLAKDVEVIVATRLSSVVAKAAQQLKLLQKTGAGVDDMPFKALPDDVWVANTSGSNPYPLAEGALALTLALAKKIVQRNKKFMKGRTGERGVLLKGKKAGIIGIGSIGQEVAKLLKGFDMKILGVKRHTDEALAEKMKLEFLGTSNDLSYVLSESDFVIITAPLTPETRGMIGEKEIGVMKPSAYIVNVGRAAIIQEEPLYQALKEERIAGAAIDVWWTPHWWDPLWNPKGRGPSRYPFWDLPNVICIPHEMSSTDSRSDKSLKIMVENILRIREGKPPINQVDKKLQY